MNSWHDIELLCPICEEWGSCGAATALENFSSPDENVSSPDGFPRGEGRFVLSCGHEITAEVSDWRLGSPIAGLGGGSEVDHRVLPERCRTPVTGRPPERRSWRAHDQDRIR